MDDQKKQDIALMRYSAISPLISGTMEDFPSRSAYFRDVSEKGIRGIDGEVRHYSPDTIKCWYENYQKRGFDGLIPTTRCDRGVSRKINEDVAARISELKEQFPRITAVSIYHQLIDEGLVDPRDLSSSTVNRFVNDLVLKRKFDDPAIKDMRRYERPHINEVWCGDTCVGPYMTAEDGKKRRVYIIALIDDCSRFIVGIGAFFNDNFINLMSVMRSAVVKYGKPKIFRFDNGHSYKNNQMELLAARLGCTLSYCHPYTPQQKAKILHEVFHYPNKSGKAA